MTDSADAERQFVYDRAHGRCEYCLFPECAGLLPFVLGRIISVKHGGSSEVENTVYSCPYCNRAKGSDLASIDRETDQLTSLFNPRTQTWSDHFRLDDSLIVPLTSCGRVTVNLLDLNSQERIQEREMLMELGMYP